MAVKHELNYNIIREALGEYLNNTDVIPMYNKKQIKEESYKLEDLQNSKAFLIDNSKRRNLEVNCFVSRESLLEVLISCMHSTLKPIYMGDGVTFDSKTKKKYEKVRACVEYANVPRNDRIEDIIWLIEELLNCNIIRDNITKEQIGFLKDKTDKLYKIINKELGNDE